MACKDCIHYDKCYLIEHYGADEEEICKDFKNKADFVKVVRCKDCKSYRALGTDTLWNNKGFGNCSRAREYWGDEPKEVYEDDFCSYGQMKST